MYGMNKSTIYLTDDLKRGVERLAKHGRTSEAEAIRTAISEAVDRLERPKPHGGFIDDDWGPIDWNNDDYLAGFGES